MMFYAMSKIPDCDARSAGFAHRCYLYAHNPHLVCAVHPDGVNGDRCLDFRLDPNAEIEDRWSPEGAARSASDASRVLVRQHLRWYGDELIANRTSRYSQLEQMKILNNHPFFTGVCPQCRHRFDRDNLTVHFDCPQCGLIDDSV
jgi:uncharacterized protein YlaI